MQITHVRNATMLVEVGGSRLLIDPMLGAKGSQDGFPNPYNALRNPLVELQTPLADLLNADVVAVTHSHRDHWDDASASLLPRSVPLLAQNAADADAYGAKGFTDVRIVEDTLSVGQTTFTRTGGSHGGEEVMATWGEALGPVSGFVIRHPGEPVLYIAGDTVMNEAVRDAIVEHKPDIIVLNTGEAQVPEGAILMGAHDVVEVHRLAPEARIVAVHMEALNHCTVTRQQVRDVAAENGIAELVIVPEDGDTFVL